ncbi:hypothetical protein PHYBOEH_011469 [Phytophthora boehmeriae]|uniref:Bzip transcription factor n=1 Tax=Phytophthora boehmeriae TaxID=109152 RepID=A0A8T1WZA9_9STRA|nr:hypothetical protein PHYBOEH_011469 [Phytophthora boehmeriae]
MPTLTLALQEEKAPVHLPATPQAPKPPIKPKANGKAKAQAKQPITATAKPATTGSDTGMERPKAKRGRKKLLHDEGQRRARRKAQCKLNQRRYRARQRGLISTLSLETEGLTGQLQELREYRDFLGIYCQQNGAFTVWNDPRPLLVVETFFRIFKAGFTLQSTEASELQESFVRLVCAPAMVAQGATTDGVEAFLVQLKRYSSYHAISEPRLKTSKVLHAPTEQLDGQADEQNLSWLVEAKGNWRLRLSRDSLMLVYPHVLRHHDALTQRIVGQTIEPEFTTVFHFNARAKVVKLESSVDFAGALLRLLGNAQDVATLLEGALISPFGELGVDLHGAMAESALTRGSKQLSLKYILL